MVLAVSNTSGFSCLPLPLTARNGASVLRIVLKAGFAIAADGRTLPLDAQPEIVMEDQYWGDPGVSSIRYESDVVLEKPLTDLVVVGQAHAPRGRAVKALDVTLAYQRNILKRLHVTGDRMWRRGTFGWTMSEPQFFTAMPLRYDRAYGGTDEEGSEARNRSGTGYASKFDKGFEGRPCPNVEFPDQLIASVSNRPAPAGFGVVSKHWQPRLAFAGTYDDAWLDRQFPLLPLDFDSRFFQSVAADQWIARPRGGEQIVVTGMSPDGPLGVTLPPCDVKIGLHYRESSEEKLMDLDTVMLEPDERRLTLTWRATADIHGDPFNLLEMVIGARKEIVFADCGCEVT